MVHTTLSIQPQSRFFLNQLSPTANVILLMGGPTSGKSSLAKWFPQFPHLSASHLIEQSLLKQHRHQYGFYKTKMAAGDLIDDVFVNQLVAAKLHTEKLTMLDGFPRNMAQWAFFKTHIGIPKAVIFLDLNPDNLLSGALNRRRIDDGWLTARHRVTLFQEETLPTIAEISQTVPLFLRINAAQSPELVAADIKPFLQLLFTCSSATAVHTVRNRVLSVDSKAFSSLHYPRHENDIQSTNQ